MNTKKHHDATSGGRKFTSPVVRTASRAQPSRWAAFFKLPFPVSPASGRTGPLRSATYGGLRQWGEDSVQPAWPLMEGDLGGDTPLH